MTPSLPLLDRLEHQCSVKNFTSMELVKREEILILIHCLRDAIAEFEKISDPRLRHKEPNDYTEKCCLMNMAVEARDKIMKQLGEVK